MQADDFKSSGSQSSKGNLNVDFKKITLKGTELADTVVLMKRMNEYNKYCRITVQPDAGMVGTFDLGTKSLQDGVADEPDLLGAGVNMATANNQILTAGIGVGYPHDLALTIKTNDAGNDGLGITLMIEFLNTSS